MAHKSELLQTHTRELFSAAVNRAVGLLRTGDLVALPTETVYGLAANAFNPEAVTRLFEVKGRPANNPVIVHVANQEMARQCVSRWPRLAQKLAKAFWPGPLTLVLGRSKKIPDVVTAGGPTVGIRWPSHPFIQAVIRESGFPLAAPSANLSSRLSPTNAEHVARQLGHKIPLIVDGGQCQVGIESTVVDLSVSPPRLLRPGMIHEQALLAITGKLTLGFGDSDEVLKSPGRLPRHYSPNAKLLVLKWRDDEDLRKQLKKLASRLMPHAPRLHSASDQEVLRSLFARTHVIAHSHGPATKGFGRVSLIPRDPEGFARAVYAELHRCDQLGANQIIIEATPETVQWRAIADRLKRAAAA